MFERCDCVIDIIFEYRQKIMTDEKSKIKKLINIQRKDLKTDFNSLNINKYQLN